MSVRSPQSEDMILIVEDEPGLLALREGPLLAASVDRLAQENQHLATLLAQKAKALGLVLVRVEYPRAKLTP